jgi:hypothetical protein
MNTALVTAVIVIAILLIHFSYVDFRFRYRDGLLWFWLLAPAPPLMWIGRATIVAAVIAGICAPLIGINEKLAVLIGALMAVHIISLILLEVLEPR